MVCVMRVAYAVGTFIHSARGSDEQARRSEVTAVCPDRPDADRERRGEHRLHVQI